MGSGYFPLQGRDEGREDLEDTLDTIEMVIDHYTDMCMELSESDNAFMDGQYIAKLQLASALIREVLNK